MNANQNIWLFTICKSGLKDIATSWHISTVARCIPFKLNDVCSGSKDIFLFVLIEGAAVQRGWSVKGSCGISFFIRFPYFHLASSILTPVSMSAFSFSSLRYHLGAGAGWEWVWIVRSSVVFGCAVPLRFPQNTLFIAKENLHHFDVALISFQGNIWPVLFWLS